MEQVKKKDWGGMFKWRRASGQDCQSESGLPVLSGLRIGPGPDPKVNRVKHFNSKRYGYLGTLSTMVGGRGGLMRCRFPYRVINWPYSTSRLEREGKMRCIMALV
jgi:hypothetical protein